MPRYSNQPKENTMATVPEFRTRFPEFVDILDPRIQLFLDDAALLMADPVRWLDFYDVAHCYHAAHLLFVGEHSAQGDGSVLGPIKKQEVDDVIVEQAVMNVTPTASDLYSTTYGKRYYSYQRICFAGIYGV
jgi:hypothetical protein